MTFTSDNFFHLQGKFYESCINQREPDIYRRDKARTKMSSTETILRFIAFLAEVSASFNKVAIFAEEQSMLHTVTTRVSPFKAEPSEYAEQGATVAVFLNAELRRPIDSEKKAMGMSLLLRHTGSLWLAEAEVGWTGEKVGWDQFDSREAQAASVEEIITKVTPLVEWMGMRFKQEIAKLQDETST